MSRERRHHDPLRSTNSGSGSRRAGPGRVRVRGHRLGGGQLAAECLAAERLLGHRLGWVNYLQWNSAGTGTFTEDTLTGTAPDEQMTSGQTPITVVVNGSQVTFTGLQ